MQLLRLTVFSSLTSFSLAAPTCPDLDVPTANTEDEVSLLQITHRNAVAANSSFDVKKCVTDRMYDYMINICREEEQAWEGGTAELAAYLEEQFPARSNRKVLWPQYLQGEWMCRNEDHYEYFHNEDRVENREECESLAVRRTHSFYNYRESRGQCFTFATCDHPVEDGDWELFVARGTFWKQLDTLEHRKCKGAGSPVVYSHMGCKQKAEQKGHPYYSYHSEDGKCKTSKNCKKTEFDWDWYTYVSPEMCPVDLDDVTSHAVFECQNRRSSLIQLQKVQTDYTYSFEYSLEWSPGESFPNPAFGFSYTVETTVINPTIPLLPEYFGQGAR